MSAKTYLLLGYDDLENAPVYEANSDLKDLKKEMDDYPGSVIYQYDLVPDPTGKSDGIMTKPILVAWNYEEAPA